MKIFCDFQKWLFDFNEESLSQHLPVCYIIWICLEHNSSIHDFIHYEQNEIQIFEDIAPFDFIAEENIRSYQSVMVDRNNHRHLDRSKTYVDIKLLLARDTLGI